MTKITQQRQLQREARKLPYDEKQLRIENSLEQRAAPIRILWESFLQQGDNHKSTNNKNLALSGFCCRFFVPLSLLLSQLLLPYILFA